MRWTTPNRPQRLTILYLSAHSAAESSPDILIHCTVDARTRKSPPRPEHADGRNTPTLNTVPQPSDPISTINQLMNAGSLRQVLHIRAGAET